MPYHYGGGMKLWDHTQNIILLNIWEVWLGL